MHFFFAASSVPFLAEFKRYSDAIATFQKSTFYEKKTAWNYRSFLLCTLSIAESHSARNDIREKLFSFSLVIFNSFSFKNCDAIFNRRFSVSEPRKASKRFRSNKFRGYHRKYLRHR